jgi:hypothetical protein
MAQLDAYSIAAHVQGRLRCLYLQFSAPRPRPRVQHAMQPHFSLAGDDKSLGEVVVRKSSDRGRPLFARFRPQSLVYGRKAFSVPPSAVQRLTGRFSILGQRFISGHAENRDGSISIVCMC